MITRPEIPAGRWLVVGLARSGIGAMRLLASRGSEVVGIDAGQPVLPDDLPGDTALGLTGGADVEFLSGGKFDAVCVSPGVPWDAPVIAAAREAGLTVIGELELGWRASRGTVLAITGTNGKTTTSELLAAICREAGRPTVLAGNVGHALTELAPETTDETVLVLEVSSFQLESSLGFTPDAGALLNLTADHLDRHRTMEAYEQAKLLLFAGMQPQQTAVVQVGSTWAIGEARRVTFGPGGDIDTTGGAIRVAGAEVIAAGELALLGPHNLLNAAAATALASAAGVAPDVIATTLRSFGGVPHRLEPVATDDGVTWINDSKATNVDSTLTALAAVAGRHVHLILGGLGKGQDFQPLAGPAAACASLLLIGEAEPQLAREIAKPGDPRVRRCGTLDIAVAQARELAQPGDVILLSPACASWDQFASYEVRGDRFKELAAARRTQA